MASDRHTLTEQIAHSVCDRYHLPPTEDILTSIPGVAFRPAAAKRVLDAADRIPIRVGYGLDFTVSAKNYAEQQLAADRTRLTHFIGVLRDGTEILGCDREALLTHGCVQIAWILPKSGGAR